MNPIAKVVLGLLTAIVLALGAWTLITLTFVYSSGERAGYVQKISSKGWICKTWEGELAMANLPGAMPEIFTFSVRDDAIAHQIGQLAGQRVSLGYEQHPGVPTSCFGDTEYFIVKVTPVLEAVVPQSAAPAAPAAPPAPPLPAN